MIDKRIVSADSMSNGIQLNSKMHKGYYALATVDEFGNIETKWSNYRDKSKFNLIALLRDVLIFIVIVTLTAVFATPLWTLRFALFIAFVYILICFINVHIGMHKDGSAKFHAVEHMVVNAYNSTGEVPSLDEIRNFSRFHSSCGTNYITSILFSLLLSIFWSMLISEINLSTFFIIGYTFFLSVYLSLFGLLNFMQIFTTEVPTDRELLVAIACLETWIENEYLSEESKGSSVG